MTAATIAEAIIAATAGAVAGYTIKHVQDTRWIRKICDAYEELIEKTNENHRKDIMRFVDYINAKQQAEIARRLRTQNPITKAAEDRANARIREELGLDFPNITEPLPEPPKGWQEIDFGGNF